jgi:hypothetical protein
MLPTRISGARDGRVAAREDKGEDVCRGDKADSNNEIHFGDAFSVEIGAHV